MPTIQKLPVQATDTIDRLNRIIAMLSGTDLDVEGAFAIIVIDKDGDTQCLYDCRGKLYALIGGLEVLKNDIIREQVEHSLL